MFFFLFIVVCFITSLCRGAKTNDSFLLRLALFFTVVSDYFMILLNKNIAGLFFFCIVQFIYVTRYSNIKRACLALSLGMLIGLAAFPFPLMIRFALVYAVLIIFSVSGSFIAFKNRKYPSPINYMVCIGMVLFLLCDINVALFNIFANSSMVNIFSSLIWVFYLPSQLTLSLTAIK